jgi:hypothetical protein
MERAPTFEEVQAFAESEGLDEKVSVSKFYNYYKETNFMFRGIPFDWKEKMREWAKNERPRKNAVKTAADYKFKFELPEGFSSMTEYLKWVVEKI